MFTLNTKLIPGLNRYGIKFRYIGDVYDPTTIIVQHKNFDICRVDVNRDDSDMLYNYGVYWFNSFSRFRERYGLSQDLIDDILVALKQIYSNESYYVGGRHLGKTYNWRNEYEKERDKFDIKDVIFNSPATIVLWEDGTKTVVKAENEIFDPEKGLAMAIAKKALGNNYGYYDVFKKYIGKYWKKKGGK